jgi:hypothetical protein
VAALVVCVVLDGGGEEGVDEGGLAKARLARNLKGGESGISGVLLPQKRRVEWASTIMVKAAPRFATILWLRRG